MAELPELSESTKRNLALQWDTLLDKHRLAEEDLAGYDGERNRIHRIATDRKIPARASSSWFAQQARARKAVGEIGVSPSVAVAKGRFAGFDWEYWRLWGLSGAGYEIYRDWLDILKRRVTAELGSLWKGRSDVTDRWYERSCGPAVEKALTALVEDRIRQARAVELQRLSRSQVSVAALERVAGTDRKSEKLPAQLFVEGAIMRPPNRPHSSFNGFLDCVSILAGEEKLEVLRRGPARGDLWMLGPGSPHFSEFKTAAGREALREVWDELPKLKELGKGAIQATLSAGLRDKFPDDNSAIIASAIWSCILLHGDQSESGQSVNEAAEVANGNGPAVSSQLATSTDVSGEHQRAPNWGSIEISFVSDERVQILNGVNSETRNYTELGFADGRNGKPNQAWVTLRVLAEARGIIQDVAKTGGDWARVEKRMQEIRAALRKHFGIAADPIPFVDGTGYKASFKICCSPSFHT